MKKTICPRCSAVNEVPPHYIGRSVSCPKCQAEYSAIEDRSGAMTELEQKRFAKAKVEANAILLTIGVVVFIGIPTLLIGGCKYLVNRSETAKEEKELRYAKAMAENEAEYEKAMSEIQAKYPSRTSTSDYRAQSHQSRSSEWYSGGTLHRSTMREWRQAAYTDRLATAADFSATLLKEQGRSVSSMNDLRPIAVSLEAAISEAGSGGHADTQSASGIAAACWMLIN
jgi:hypothetical protein